MDLISVLAQCQVADQAIRSQAERNLESWEVSSYGPFLLELARILDYEDPSISNVRVLAGIKLKNMIYTDNDDLKEQKYQRWRETPEEIKNQARAHFVHALTTPNSEVSKAAAQTSAAYAAADFPGCEGFLEQFHRNVMDAAAAPECKVASLSAIGFMLEQLEPPDEVTDALRERLNQLLTAIVFGLDQENIPMRLAGIKALQNSIIFIGHNFEVPAERDMILLAILKAASCPEVLVRELAYETLGSVVSLYYDQLEVAHFQRILEMSQHAIQTDDHRVAVQAIEFWTAVAKVEQDKSEDVKNEVEDIKYLQVVDGNSVMLVNLMLETTTKQADDVGDDTWTISDAGNNCIQEFALLLEDKIVNLVLPFVQANIGSAEWRTKEAAVSVFGMILEGPDQAALAPIVAQAVPTLVDLGRDANAQVRDTCMWVLGKICLVQRTALGLLSPDYVPVMLQRFYEGLDDPEVRVANNACYAIQQVGEACEPAASAPTNILTICMSQMLEKLLTTVPARPDSEESNLKFSALEAANVWIRHAAQDCYEIVRAVLLEALRRLARTADMPQSEERNQMQSNLCTLVGECMKKVEATDLKAPLEDGIPVADIIMENLLKLLGQHDVGFARQDAFMCIGFAADKLELAFDRYRDAVMPHILAATTRMDLSAELSISIGVAADIFRAVKRQIPIGQVDALMQQALEILRNHDVERSVKPHVISFFSDVAMGIEPDPDDPVAQQAAQQAPLEGFERYIDHVLPILVDAGSVMTVKDDEDLNEYVGELRDSILEAYTGIVQSLISSKKQDFLLPHIDSMMTFIGHIVQAEMANENTVAVSKGAAGLLGDLGQAFGARVELIKWATGQPVFLEFLRHLAGIEGAPQQIASWSFKIWEEVARSK